MTEYIKRLSAIASVNNHFGNDDAILASIVCIDAADVVPGEDFRDCRNELCLKCGSYQYDYKTHECDGCRWRH